MHNYIIGDDDREIIIPKSIRPIIEYQETCVGDKKGAKRQFRLSNLHIREYDEYYSVHHDIVDPLKDPFGHLLVDAPEYLAAVFTAISWGSKVGRVTYRNYNSERHALNDAIVASCFAGSIAGSISYIATKILKTSI
jgi:hypothetical protein